ncbi:SusC/RagA family TonB-linked outer membrane protein [Flavobacterium sp. MAH-1]|uniref:SusC/RagA family TonB-linked outer membrane protein n=1 Tax=Flavobacterium agri TaxID=2743471 RepID=A0A7Y8Y2J1_9FLAO|nr:SusC/RagA family TonB-linked outer membrane protein [Flavobacterium agri]NUY80699.1 SusC/RagA family TonB-linked outer membrane protein [Flavobacterium agri]NYA70723.1 SusC/RagA family TonB-linked outer membrane protein [Flavobacterium agri]
MKTIYKKLFIFLLLLPFGALAQGVLKGTVTEKATGQPLPGVNVVVQGTTNGTSTDFDGNYTLNNVKRGDKIVFSYIGFKDIVVEYSGQATLSQGMEEDANQLQEVVVQVGYGTVKKKDATGSVTTVTTKDFNKGANVTTENLLQGRVAGVTINTSGAPGSGSEIRIRGGASLFASNDPLIVVDGLPIDNATNTGSTSFLASLNPNTIESVTVLKDASATAIYGSRASNGVIIIVTKSGSKNLSVDYNFQYGTGRLMNKVDVFNANDYRAMIQQYRPQDAALLGNANTDWQDEIYRRTDFVDNNLQLRGNLFGRIPARLSIGNTYTEGLRLTNDFNRSTVSASINPTFFNDHLKMRVNANYSNEKNRFADGVEGTAIRFDPTQPVRQAGSPWQGYFEYYTGPNSAGDYPLSLAPRNPVAQLMQTYDRGENNRILGNVEFDYKLHFFPELRAVVNLGFDEANGTRRRDVARDVVASGPSNGDDNYGTHEYTEEVRRNKLLDAYLVYNKKVGELDIEATAGYSYQKFERQLYYTRNTLQPNYGTPGSGLFPETDTDIDRFLIGFFGRTNLNFKDKYLLTLAYRRDGSSKFKEGDQFGNFPAASFAWRVSQEFFKDNQTVSDLKLRVGYGITGQQNVIDGQFLQTITTGDGQSQIVFGNNQYNVAIPNRISPKIQWEETTTFNAGLDYGFLNNRITGAIDVFYKKSDKLLVDAAVADGSNNSNRAYQNIGAFTTKGIEFNINAEVSRAENFKWNVNFNATTYRREIDELIYGADIFVGENVGGTGTPGQIFSEGYSPWSFYVYKQLYNNDGTPIEGAYADLNGDGTFNAEDKYIYKNPDPDLTMGFSSNMVLWKNIDFYFNLRASLGNHIYNGVNASQAQLNLLKTDTALNNTPRNVLTTGFTTTSDVLLSDIYIEDASFLKVDNITLGYTFPKFVNETSSIRLFTGVQNAFVFTKYTGLDPEITNNGLDKTIYPRQRTFLFGVNVKF